MTRTYDVPITCVASDPLTARETTPDPMLVNTVCALAERVEAVVEELEKLNEKFFAGPEYRVRE